MHSLPDSSIQALKAQHYQATLVSKRMVHDELAILRVKPDHPIMPHRAGQYTTLGLGAWEPRHPLSAPENLTEEAVSRLIRRQYSLSHPLLNASGELIQNPLTELEFYIVLVRGTETAEEVPALTPRLFQLEEGARLFAGDKITGFYTLDSISPDETILFFSTGTGEAPNNYMLWELLHRGHTGRIISACCTRLARDLAYREVHEALMQKFPNYKYLALTTREPAQLSKRYLQDLVTSGELEHQLGHALQPEHTHVYLCGNPQMIGAPKVDKQTGVKTYPEPVGLVQLLEERGFRADSRLLKIKGNLHFEEYW